MRLVLGRKIEGFVALACRAAAVLGSHDGAAWNALANGSTAATATTHIVRISLLCFAELELPLTAAMVVVFVGFVCDGKSRTLMHMSLKGLPYQERIF